MHKSKYFSCSSGIPCSSFSVFVTLRKVLSIFRVHLPCLFTARFSLTFCVQHNFWWFELSCFCLKTASISRLQVFILFQVGLTHRRETQMFRSWIWTDRSDIPAHSNNVMMKHQLMSSAQPLCCCLILFLLQREGVSFPCPKYFNTQVT